MPEEFDLLRTKGPGRSSRAYNAIRNLQVGEAIKILKAEWGSRSKTPSAKCRAIEKKYSARKVKYLCVTLADGTGWAVKRLA